MKPLLCPRHHRQVKKAVKTCLACKFFTTVCSSSDLVGSISSLCVWRCGHLLVLLLSGGKVQGDPLYRLLSRTGLPLTCLVVLACHGLSIQLEGSALG
jgi:hypothetical protein